MYKPLIISYCLRCGLNYADAEDVLQSAMTRVFLAFKNKSYTYEHGKSKFHVWLFTVVRNCRFEALRSKRRAPMPTDPTLPPGGTGEQKRTAEIDKRLQPDALLDAKDHWDKATMQRAFELVKEHSRFASQKLEIFKAHVIESQDVAEVAKHYSVKPADVHKAKNEVLPRLAEFLCQLTGTEPTALAQRLCQTALSTHSK